MDGLRRFQAIVLADFRERSRSTRFWVVLALVAIATWWCFPPLDAGYSTVSIGNARGFYSPAWIGMVLALIDTTMLTLLGFYIVRGTVTRDFETRVWELLVATPMTRAGWLLAKWTSHMAVLMLLVLAGLAVGIVAQFWRGESTQIAPWQWLQPALVITLPALAVTAFLAVLFDVLPWLRRSGGNILYFFVWIFLFVALAAAFDREDATRDAGVWMSEPGGLSMAMRDIRAVLFERGEVTAKAGFVIGMEMRAADALTFVWDSWTPRAIDVFGRLIWVGVALAGLVALAPMLEWAAARSGGRHDGGEGRPGLRLVWLDWLLRPLDGFAGGRLLAAELRLVLRERRRLWWLALLVLWIVQLTATPTGMAIAAIGGWLLGIDVFARAALRERDTATAALVFTAPGAGHRLLAARIASALALAVLVVLPALLREAAQAPLVSLAMLVTAASVAMLGLAVSTACRNPRPFELMLVFAAYVGVQGGVLLNPVVDPLASLAYQAWLLPVALAVLLPAWALMLRRR